MGLGVLGRELPPLRSKEEGGTDSLSPSAAPISVSPSVSLFISLFLSGPGLRPGSPTCPTAPRGLSPQPGEALDLGALALATRPALCIPRGVLVTAQNKENKSNHRLMLLFPYYPSPYLGGNKVQPP